MACRCSCLHPNSLLPVTAASLPDKLTCLLADISCSWLSRYVLTHCCPADNPQVQRHLTLYHGVIPLLLKFTTSAEETFDAAMGELVARGYLTQGQIVALVQSGKRPIWRSASTHTIQVTCHDVCRGWPDTAHSTA